MSNKKNQRSDQDDNFGKKDVYTIRDPEIHKRSMEIPPAPKYTPQDTPKDSSNDKK
jgi:hypothetical protein